VECQSPLIEVPEPRPDGQQQEEAPEYQPHRGGRSVTSGGAHTDAELSDLSASQADSAVGDTVAKPMKTIVVNGVPYLRLHTIGRGGSSKVYQVRNPAGQLYALKRVAVSCGSHYSALANEVTLLQQLKDCPHVIQVIDAEVNPERCLIHIVMEQGDMDLGQLLQAEPDMSLGDIQALWRQMLEAVQVVHTERIVHSDLKPGNFVLVEGRLKLIDFGIAKRLPGETTNIHRETSVGTISYMAPEAAKQGSLKCGRSSDIWSLGIILYQMVYRRSPFAHLEPMQRLLAISDPQCAVDFPVGHRLECHTEAAKAELADVLKRCLQRDPQKRPGIPELLSHPFLRDKVTISRSVFDHAMQSLVAGFYRAARDAIESVPVGGAKGINDIEEEEEEAPHHGNWEALADQVWEQLLATQSVAPDRQRRVAGSDGNERELFGFEGFGNWLARGVKRRRLSQGPGNAMRELPSSSGWQAAMPPPAMSTPAPAPASASAPAPARAVVAAPAAAAAAVAAARAMQPKQAPPPIAPLGVKNSAAPPAGAGAAAMHAEALQKQRGCLRKVAQSSEANKENGVVEVESAVMRRLRARRALVADERTEELTQMTRWTGNIHGVRA